MFNCCKFKKWLIFFLWYFTIIALCWKVYFIVAVFYKNWGFIMVYLGAWETLYVVGDNNVFSNYLVVFQFVYSVQFLFLNFIWSPFNCYLGGICCCPFFPFSSARLFIMYLGVLLCACMFIMTECRDRWTPSLLSDVPPLNFNESLFFVCARLF